MLAHQEIASGLWVARWHPHAEAFSLEIKGREDAEGVFEVVWILCDTSSVSPYAYSRSNKNRGRIVLLISI